MSLLGAEGLARVAAACHAGTRALAEALTSLTGVRRALTGPAFHETVLAMDRPVAPVLEALAARGILGGYDLSADFPELGHALLVCATETKTAQDISRYASALGEVLKQQKVA
jgi:glycine dehydrogenase subunit 1